MFDGEPDPRRTDYDVDAAMAQIRATAFPDVDDVMRRSLIEPVDPAWIARYLEDRGTAGRHRSRAPRNRIPECSSIAPARGISCLAGNPQVPPDPPLSPGCNGRGTDAPAPFNPRRG